MAESSLSLGRADLLAEVAFYLGWGRTSANWTSDQSTRLQAILNAGLRQFYFTPGHSWSFLHPVTTLTTAAAYSTGTIAITSGVVTLTTGTWPSWAASGVLVVSGNSYSISTRDSGSQVTLDDTSITVASGTSYEINQQDYDLPDSFGELESDVTFAMNQATWSIREVNEAQIRVKRQSGANTGRPCECAIRAKTTTGVTGQRYEIMFWPTPDAAYTLSYKYTVLTDALSSSFPYPYGGMSHAETILASCLDVAERKENNMPQGPESLNYQKRLAASISHDLRKAPKFLGYNGDPSMGGHVYERLKYVRVNSVLPG